MTALSIEMELPVFDFYLLGNGLEQHVKTLLHVLNPPLMGRIADLGSGVGIVVTLLGAMRPDLKFTLLNISEWQLSLMEEYNRVCGDIESLPLKDNSHYGVMISYALGHGRMDTILEECFRIMKRGARLIIWDLFAYEIEAFVADHFYVPWLPSRVELEAKRIGFRKFRHGVPKEVTFQHPNAAVTRKSFEDAYQTIPVLYSMEKA